MSILQEHLQALYIISGIRGMERGTLSEQRNPDGSEKLANMELVRLAMPRRVFTLHKSSLLLIELFGYMKTKPSKAQICRGTKDFEILLKASLFRLQEKLVTVQKILVIAIKGPLK